MEATGTNSLFVMNHKEIRNMKIDHHLQTPSCQLTSPEGQPQLKQPCCRGNFIKDYSVKITTPTSDLITATVLWNFVLGTERTTLMCIGITFNLYTPLDRY